jgi:hypothetical protein
MQVRHVFGDIIARDAAMTVARLTLQKIPWMI